MFILFYIRQRYIVLADTTCRIKRGENAKESYLKIVGKFTLCLNHHGVTDGLNFGYVKLNTSHTV